MTEDAPHPSADNSREQRFIRTQWSQVLRAADPLADGYEAALQQLCRAYWPPLYAYARRVGHSPQDAEDLIQAFFARLLDKNYLAAADQDKGRLRTFLLVALKRFLANEWERQHAQKRGGFAAIVDIDRDLAEDGCCGELAHREQPDTLMEKRWAMTLIGQVMGRLQLEYENSQRADLFVLLRSSLTRDDAAMGYAEIASRLNSSTAAVKMAAMRLRARYQALLREEIARTVATPDEIDDEIRHLFAVISS